MLENTVSIRGEAGVVSTRMKGSMAWFSFIPLGPLVWKGKTKATNLWKYHQDV